MPATFYFPDTPDLPLPPGHRFPAGKYKALRALIEGERVLGRAALLPSPVATRAELLTAHEPAYVDAVQDGTLSAEAQRRIGLPWSPVLALRARTVAGGTLAAARAALRDGLSGQLAGGTHHAHAGFGAGFCVFNDVAVAALTLLAGGSIGRAAVLDLDVHQGDGNADILGPDPRVLVASVHGERNFPFRKPPSDIDIALPDGADDGAMLAAVAELLPVLAAFRPDVLFYIAGVDPLAEDRLGRLSMTADGLMARDRAVLEVCRRRGLPVVLLPGGGYAEPISLTVAAYANTFRAAADVFGLCCRQKDGRFGGCPADGVRGEPGQRR